VGRKGEEKRRKKRERKRNSSFFLFFFLHFSRFFLPINSTLSLLFLSLDPPARTKSQGYVFAVGSKGIYFGGKDIVVSEASGPLSFCVLPPSEESGESAEGSKKEGSSPSSRFALMDMRVGAGAAAAAQEWSGASSSSSSSSSSGPAAAAAAAAAAAGASLSPPRRGGVSGSASFSSLSSSSPLRRRSSPSRAGGASKAASPARKQTTTAKTTATARATAAPPSPPSSSSRPPLPPPPPSPLIPRTAEERAAAVAEAVAEASGGARAGKAVAARFLAKIGSARALERYARKAALPHGPKEAWPGAEEEGAAAETRDNSAAVSAASRASPGKHGSSLVGRLMKKAASRRARKEEKAAARKAGSSSLPAAAGSVPTSETGDRPMGVPRAASSGSLLLGSGAAAATGAAGAATTTMTTSTTTRTATTALASSSSRSFLSDAQDDIEAAAIAEAAMPDAALGRGGGGEGEEEEEDEEEGINLERLLSSSSDDDDGGGDGKEKRTPPFPPPPPPPDGGHLGTASAPMDAETFTASEIPTRLQNKEEKNANDDASSRGGKAAASNSSSSSSQQQQRPLRVVVRLCDVALVGEKGSRCPSLSVAELSLELEIHGKLAVKYERGKGGCWAPAGKCSIEVSKVTRSVRGASVPVPPALLKLIVGAVLPPVFQGLLLGALPAELGEYLLDAGVGVSLAGHLVALGPALPSLDAPLAAASASSTAASSSSAQEPETSLPSDDASKEARAVVGLSAAQAKVLDALFCHPRFSLVGVGGGGGSGSSMNASSSAPAPASAAAAATNAAASESGESSASNPQQRQQRPNPPLTLGSLVRLRHRYARHPKLWEATSALWDAAASALAAAWGLGEKPPPLDRVTAAAASALALKPLRASLALSHADAGCNVDAAIRCLRMYFERQARELAVVAGGGGNAGGNSSGNGSGGSQLPQPPGLAAALGALEAWHAYTVSRLAGFKASFRGASARVVAQADARGLSLGAEGARYVGPLRIRLPVKLKSNKKNSKEKNSGDSGGEAGGWSFEIPLPDPSSYAVKRFVDACRSAMASSSSLGRVEAQAAAAARKEKPGGEALPPPPTRAREPDPMEALGWFCADDSERAAAGLPPASQSKSKASSKASASDSSSSSVPLPEPSCVPPTRLGTISVDGARARVRLDEESIAELLGAGGPSGGLAEAPAASAVRLARSAARVLAALGDVARLSFAPAASNSKSKSDDGGNDEDDEDEDSGPEFVLVAESAAAASLHVDVAGVSFATSEGVTPARLVRLAHGVARAVLLAMMEGGKGGGGGGGGGGEDEEEQLEEQLELEQEREQKRAQLAASLASLDAKFDLAHAHLGREALDAAVCVDATAKVDRERLGGALVLRVRGLPPGCSEAAAATSASAAGDNTSQQQPPPPPPPPLFAVNDLELMTLFGARPPGPDDEDDEAMAA